MADASQTVPGDFNALYDDAARVARGGAPATLRAAQPAIARMTNDVPNVSVHLDEATQNPVQVTVAQGSQGQVRRDCRPVRRLRRRPPPGSSSRIAPICGNSTTTT